MDNRTENKEMTLVSALDPIVKEIKKNKYTDESISHVRKELDYANSILGTTDLQTILFGLILEESGTSRATSNKLCSILGLSYIQYMDIRKDLKELAMKRLIIENRYTPKSSTFRIPDSTLEAIEQNKCPDDKEFKGLNTRELFMQIHQIFQSGTDYNMNGDALYNEIMNLLEINKEQNEFIRNCTEKGLFKTSPTEQVMAFYMMYHRQYYYEKVYSLEELENQVCDSPLQDEDILQNMRQGKSLLFQYGFVEFECRDGIVDNSRLRLTPMTEELMEEVLDHTTPIDNKTSIPDDEQIKAENIQKRELFYNQEEMEQMKRMEQILEQDNFQKIGQRLQEKNMQKGIIALFYGQPGTGKTASVMELARKSGRDIYFVDQSKLRSKWHGESEKQMKKLFDGYKKLVQESSVCPILVLNECDSMMYKRIADIDNSCDQTNNAFINIVLNELENFEGILLATSNLEGALDDAFERRILFKVKFNKPDLETRKKIWLSRIDELDQDEAGVLAKKYPFTGGQIENISRKVNIDYILTGEHASMETIQKECEHETFKKVEETGHKVGF